VATQGLRCSHTRQSFSNPIEHYSQFVHDEPGPNAQHAVAVECAETHRGERQRGGAAHDGRRQSPRSAVAAARADLGPGFISFATIQDSVNRMDRTRSGLGQAIKAINLEDQWPDEQVRQRCQHQERPKREPGAAETLWGVLHQWVAL
jgi:hypothetical protein